MEKVVVFFFKRAKKRISIAFFEKIIPVANF
jgi:hypothetical protein